MISLIVSKIKFTYLQMIPLSAIIPNSMELKTLVINSFQSDLRTIEWAEKWLVNFNTKKIQLMTISHKKASQLMSI